MQSTHWAAVTTNIWQLRPTHDSYDHTKAAVTTYWCFRKWQLRPTRRNQNTPIVAKPSSAILITAVEVEGTYFPVSGRDCASWYCC